VGERIANPDGEQHTDRTGGSREQERFREQLLCNATAAAAECEADGEFALSC
jgi:hypothetical protein